MAFRFEFEANHCLLAARFTGKLSDETLAAFYTEAPEYVTQYAVQAGIFDFSGSTGVDLSTDIVQRLAAMPPIFPDPIQRVIVAPSELLFGLSRMFKSLHDDKREGLHIVRTEQAAFDYLGIADPLQFVPLPAPDTLG